MKMQNSSNSSVNGPKVQTHASIEPLFQKPPGQAIRLAEKITLSQPSNRQPVAPQCHPGEISWNAVPYSNLTLTRRTCPPKDLENLVKFDELTSKELHQDWSNAKLRLLEDND